MSNCAFIDSINIEKFELRFAAYSQHNLAVIRSSGVKTKHYIANTLPWFRYIRGENPGYAEMILKANILLIAKQLEKMRSEQGEKMENRMTRYVNLPYYETPWTHEMKLQPMIDGREIV